MTPATFTPERRAMAKRIALGFMRRLPRNVVLADLEQAALLGLWDGLRKHPDAPDHYLKFRIRGQVQDYLRAQDWFPRGHRSRVTQSEHMRAAVVGFDDIHPCFIETISNGDPTPEDLVIERQLSAAALSAPVQERDATVVRSVVAGRLMKDVARELGCSEARVSQLHSRGLRTMRDHLARVQKA